MSKQDIEVMTASIKVSDIDGFNSLLNLLADNYDSLPDKVKIGIDTLAESEDISVFLDVDDLLKMTGGHTNYKGLKPSHELDARLCGVDRLRRLAFFYERDDSQRFVEFVSLSILLNSGDEIKLW